MADEIKEIPKSEYEYSPKKEAELYSEMNIIDLVSFEEVQRNVEPKEEEIKQLCIYIRNYDGEGNLIDSPVGAIKTCIDTFERKLLKTTWFEFENVKLSDGSTKYKRILRQTTEEISNSSDYADEEILKVKPHIIEHRMFVNTFLRQYLENFKINKMKGGKTLYIEYHSTSKEGYDFYDMTFEDLSYFIAKNYDIIGLNLDGKEVSISDNKLIELKTLSIENSIIKILSDNGLSISVDNLFLNEDKISSKYNDKFLSTFSATIKEYAKISYISFTDEMCKFDFLNTNTDDMQKWMQSTIDIYSIEYINNKKSYSYPRERLFNFKGFYTVKVNSLNLHFDTLDMNIMKVENTMELNLGSINSTANEYKKNLIILSKINKLTACGVYITQNLDPSNDIYIFHTSNGAIYGEYKYTALFGTKIGLFSSNADNVESVSLSSVKALKFNKPIKWNSGAGVNKMVFSSCFLENIEDLSISIPNISIFKSRFANIKNLEFIISKKIFTTDTSFSGDKISIQLTDGASALSSEDKYVFKEFNVQGNSGEGDVNFTKSVIEGNELKIESMNKISSEDSNFDFKDILLVGNNITSFKPAFNNSKLKNFTMKGKVKNSVLFIDNSNKYTINYNFEAISGVFNIFYTNEVSGCNLNLDTAKLSLNFDATKDESKIDDKINLICKNDCTGSILTSYKSTLKFVPKTEGSFKDLKQVNFDNFKANQYKDKIVFGYKK